MDSQFEKFKEKISKLEAQPSEDLFDEIFERYAKKRKKRVVFWLITLLLASVAIVGSIYFINWQPEQSDSKNQEKTQSNHLVEAIPNKNKIGEKLKNETDLKETKIQNVSKNKLTNGSNSAHRIQPNNLVENEFSNKTPFENKTPKTIFSKRALLDKNLINVENYPIIQSFKTIDIDLSSRLKMDELEAIDLPPRVYLIIDEVPLLLSNSFKNRKTESSLASQRFSIFAQTSLGNQQFCAFSDAYQTTFGFGFSYRFYKKLGFKMTYNQSNLNYSYEFTSHLYDRFGQTDKFPALSLVSSAVENISNTIDYQSFDVGFNYDILTTKKHLLAISLHQEFVFNSKQKFEYKLLHDSRYEFLDTDKSIRPNQLTGDLIYNFKIYKNFGVGIQVAYSYGLKYFGREKERYSGIKIGGNVAYSF